MGPRDWALNMGPYSEARLFTLHPKCKIVSVLYLINMEEVASTATLRKIIIIIIIINNSRGLFDY